MSQTWRLVMLLAITAVMAGCKLAVIVVEGGEVQSSNSWVCVASEICIVDVTDPNFSESFRTVPHSGWYFQKWNSGDGFFCGDSPEPECTLSFEGHEETEAVEDMVASSEIFYLMPVFKRINSDPIRTEGRAVIVNGKEWLQPADFVAYSYNQLSEVCPKGSCAGSLPGSSFDLTGYHWAASDDEKLSIYPTPLGKSDRSEDVGAFFWRASN